MSPRSAQARRKVLETQELPPLPTAATELLTLLKSEDTDELEQMRGILERDPGLAARVMGWANSAYFGTRGNVRNLDRAIFGVLGLRTVSSLLMSIVLNRTFDTRACSSFDLTDYWYRALLTGHCAKAAIPLRQEGPRLDPEDGFLGGLLHNLGLLLLVHLYPEAMEGVFDALEAPDDTELRDGEEAAVGVDHCAAGAWLASRWHLPDEVVAVISDYGVRRPVKADDLAAQVGFCRQQVDQLLARGASDPEGVTLKVPHWLPIPQERWQDLVAQMQEERGRLRSLAEDLS